MYVIATNAKSIAKINGMMLAVIFSIVVPIIGAATNKLTPTGGVAIPIVRFITINTPKCTGSTPAVMAMGARISPNKTK